MNTEREKINLNNIIIGNKKIYHAPDIEAYSHLLNRPETQTLDENDFIIGIYIEETAEQDKIK